MRVFWLLTAACAASIVGNTFLFLAIPWALLETTGSPLTAVLATAARAAPFLVAPLLGPLLDQFDRRYLFFTSEVVQGASVAVIPLLLAHGQIAGVFGALVVIGLADVVSTIAAGYGLIPSIVPKENLDQATSRFSAIMLVARFVGPAVAGLIIGAVGTTWALYADAASFLLTALSATTLPKSTHDRAVSSLGHMLRDGIQYFRSRRDLQRLTLTLAVYNLGAGAVEPTLLAEGQYRWEWSATALGLATSSGAIAAAVGSWLSPRTKAGTSGRTQITNWLALSALGAVGLLMPAPLVVVASFAILSFGEGGVNAATIAYRQREIPSELAGRVNTIIRTFVTGAIPVSALALGATASLAGAVWTFAPAAAACLMAATLWWARHGAPSLHPTQYDTHASHEAAR